MNNLRRLPAQSLKVVRLFPLAIAMLALAAALAVGLRFVTGAQPAASHPSPAHAPLEIGSNYPAVVSSTVQLSLPLVFDQYPAVVSPTAQLYLPVVFDRYPLQTIFGVQMSAIDAIDGLSEVTATDSTWVRAAGVDWSAVEATEGIYNWSVLASSEAQWQTATGAGLTTFVIVGATPSWAQGKPGYTCGIIKSDKLAAFADFMHALVARYSAPPYSIQYWEIWNEPDIDPSLVPGNSAIGCWGDQTDPYYGGGYYADMLKVVYPQIKAANPAVKVIVGGLLLDCDPNNPPAGKDCTPSRFLEGILREGGGPYFDGVGTHSYDFYAGALGSYGNPNWNTISSNAIGPSMALEVKTGYVNGLLAAYGVSGKFLANNESAVGLYYVDTNATYETTKAYYVAQVYGAALAQHLLANVWYSLNDDWHHQALLNSDNTPRPAYFAYQFASQQLKDVTYLQAITSWAGIKGYVFDRQGHPLWLLWAQDGGIHPLTLPGVPAAIYHVDGTTLAVTGNQLSVGVEPLYVAWP